MENTSWECGIFYVKPTDIIAQSPDQLNGWIHMEVTLLTMLSLLRKTHANINPHRSYCHNAGNIFRAGNLFRAKMFHTLQSVTIWPRRTLPDSAGLPPGLSSTTMDPSRPTPRSERLVCAAPTHPRTIFLYGSSAHNNMTEPVYESTHGTLPTQINPTIT